MGKQLSALNSGNTFFRVSNTFISFWARSLILGKIELKKLTHFVNFNDFKCQKRVYSFVVSLFLLDTGAVGYFCIDIVVFLVCLKHQYS